MGFVHFLSVLQAQLRKMEKEPQRGLMYVEVLLNKKSTKVMLDTRASNTFITLGEAKRYVFKVENDFRQMKAVNLSALVIMGNTKDVKIKIGYWEGKVNLTIAIIENFDFVLGLDFMMKAQAIPFLVGFLNWGI
ncbi:Uncharacterized protein TCM_013852 [Theobroma cacao]|uniref:Uncharacterized protein n=1 Tax=Theobroma cacao TaxID=3641 RepID=A0A061G413_THECC|nr:Uncharacterized protein TCM_013852 [Theobroma cacao]